ncbi:hypothetical protein [Anabaena sp. UHCC 0399]|uniref:hypothetical protein n=1 Tax=Anabaena sp. UHCC 0399 TaxID=3110238 RepID=UPI002B202C2D|nr:hypothetical protein [Anabaena sp. UHCC 0399]MEA5565774.1 hypothetical protein [Anabaena sp. UHCC 0399]
MSRRLNNQKQPTQQYRQPLASVFNVENVVMKTQFNISVSVQVTVSSRISHFVSKDSHTSALQKEEVPKNSTKFSLQSNYQTIQRLLGILSVLLVATNNGIQVWQNLHSNENISYLSDQLSSIKKVQLNSRKTE